VLRKPQVLHHATIMLLLLNQMNEQWLVRSSIAGKQAHW
jgi:hypothetical protein